MAVPPPVPVTNVADLAGAVRHARRVHGLTQGELAQRIGVSRPWISQFESGHTPHAGIDRILALVNVLGIRLTVTAPAAPATTEPTEPADDREPVPSPGTAPDTSRRPWPTDFPPTAIARSTGSALDIPEDTDPETAAFLTDLLAPQLAKITRTLHASEQDPSTPAQADTQTVEDAP